MAWCATGEEPWATWLGGSRRARDGEVPEVTDRRVSAGSLWAVVPKTPSSPAGRGPLPTAAWGRARIEGGGWDALRGLRRLAKADEGRWRSRRGANRSTEQKACWLGGTEGAGPELTAHWSRWTEEAWPARARGRAGGRVGLACPLAGPATSAAGAGPSSTTVQPSGPPRSGWGSREGKRDEATRAAGSRQRAREAGQRGRGALRCRRVLAGCCGPRARGARRRAHYAGGLPAAAMASRAPLRAARSPQGPRGQAAPAATVRAPLPSAGCCPLPPGRNSSSRPGLLLLLLLLLQDVGAQQGEWWPGRVGLQRLLAVEGTWGRTERCCYTTLYVPRGGSATLCLKFVPLYFSARPFISLKRGTWDTAMEASFLSPPGLMDGVGSKWKSI